MRYIPLTALLALAACSDPTLSVGAVLSADCLSVAPAVSGTVGGATVTVQP